VSLSTIQSLDWRGDGPALDAALNNTAAVPDSARIMSDWERRSANIRSARAIILDVPYGSRERNALNLFLTSPAAHTLLFIHGGYWQMRAKETFSFIAEGPLQHGMNVALAGYTLAPDASIDDMVREVGQAIDVLHDTLEERGHGTAIWLSGWSAGGHLATMQLGHPVVRGGIAISGLYDLQPIRDSYLNAKLQLSPDAALRNSPLTHRTHPSKPLAIAVGADELPLLRAQSREFAERRRACGAPGEFREIQHANHFSILDQLAFHDGELVRMLLKLIHQAPGKDQTP
jgi:arylformamidase